MRAVLVITGHWRPLYAVVRWKATQLLQPELCLNIGQSLDEEVIPSYIASQYYPPKAGGILKGQYQVVGKSGYRDVASIVWLVRDMK